MQPMVDWQLQEAIDHELRRPVWHIILDRKATDLLRDLGLVQLDDMIKSLEKRKRKGAR